MDCAKGLTGRIIRPGDPEYDRARLDFNLRFSKFPCTIVFCQRVKDVVHAVNKARETGIPIRSRCGRHSYEAFSVVNDGIVADVSEIRDVHINKRNHTAEVEAGIGLLDLYDKLWQYGFTFPGGTCPTVGISGLTLGGGFGMLSRLYGLSCDNMLRVEMVNAAGKVICADTQHNPDLFWASQGGGGGNFGIATSYRLQIYPVSDTAIFDIKWRWKDAVEVIKAWQEWASNTDLRIGAILDVNTCKNGTITSSGQFLGSQSALVSLLRPLLAAGKPVEVQIQTVPYIEAIRKFAGVSRPHPFKNTGAFVYDRLPSAAIRIMLSFMKNAPSQQNQVEFQNLSGAVSRITPTATAYVHRPAEYNLQYIAQWTDAKEEAANIQWVDALRKALLPYTVGTYVNFSDLHIADWPQAYYGDNFDRLKVVKRQYDPRNLFRFAQSIPPADITGGRQTNL